MAGRDLCQETLSVLGRAGAIGEAGPRTAANRGGWGAWGGPAHPVPQGAREGLELAAQAAHLAQGAGAFGAGAGMAVDEAPLQPEEGLAGGVEGRAQLRGAGGAGREDLLALAVAAGFLEDGAGAGPLPP